MKSPVALNETITFSFALNGLEPNTSFVVKDFVFAWDELFRTYNFTLKVTDPNGNEIDVQTDKSHYPGRDIIDLINSKTKLSNLYLDYFDIKKKNPTILYNGKRVSIQRSFPKEILMIHNLPVNTRAEPAFGIVDAIKVVPIENENILFEELMAL